jgi:hypothetical protein
VTFTVLFVCTGNIDAVIDVLGMPRVLAPVPATPA